MPPTLIIIGIACFMGAIVVWGILDSRRTIKRIATTLRELGFRVQALPPRRERTAAHRRFNGFKKHYHAATSLRVLADRSEPSLELEAAVSIRSSKNGQWIDVLIAAEIDRNDPIPRIEIGPKGSASKLFDKTGLSAPPMTHGELFTARDISCEDPVQLEQIATDTFQAAILSGLEEDHWILENQDDSLRIMLHRPSVGGSRHALGAMIKDLTNVANSLAI